MTDVKSVDSNSGNKQKMVVVGGGTAAGMTAAYLVAAFGAGSISPSSSRRG